ncbi:MAG: manganese efflux pump, partial [Eubacterium sp.]|nr:manganese efflux pump [Eubacterium sp.]
MLGAGLAMDAFSVSVANALANPQMKKRKMLSVAGVFAFFQFIMPLIGWLCVKTVVNYFEAFEKFVPYIA